MIAIIIGQTDRNLLMLLHYTHQRWLQLLYGWAVYCWPGSMVLPGLKHCLHTMVLLAPALQS